MRGCLGGRKQCKSCELATAMVACAPSTRTCTRSWGGEGGGVCCALETNLATAAFLGIGDLPAGLHVSDARHRPANVLPCLIFFASPITLPPSMMEPWGGFKGAPSSPVAGLLRTARLASNPLRFDVGLTSLTINWQQLCAGSPVLEVASFDKYWH